jgi:hypothetical protein
MLDDHTAYWTNLDEFVSLMYDEIARSRLHDPLPDLRIGKSRLREVADRRRWRVAIGRFIWWSGAAGVLVLVVRRWSSWQGFASWAWGHAYAWLAGTFGVQAGVVAPRLSADWPAVGVLATVILTYGVARRMWAYWNESEMTAALQYQPSTPSGIPVSVLCAMTFLLALLAGIIEGSFPPYWLFMLCFITPSVFMFLEPGPKPTRSKVRDDASPTSDSEERSKVDQLLLKAFALGTLIFWPFALGFSAWKALTWLTAHLLNGSVAGFRPDSISSYTIGGVTTIFSLVVLAIWAIWASHRRKQSPQTQAEN